MKRGSIPHYIQKKKKSPTTYNSIIQVFDVIGICSSFWCQFHTVLFTYIFYVLLFVMFDFSKL